MPYVPTVDLTVVTDAPLDVAARVDVELPQRIRLTTSVGWMPRAYLDGLNELATASGWWDDTTATLIGATLQDAVVWRTHVGWRPSPKLGFVFGAGYGFAGLGGSLTGQEIVEAALGASSRASGEAAVDAAASVHMLDVTAGWEWTVKRRFLVRAEVGGAFTVGSAVRLTPSTESRFERVTDTITVFPSKTPKKIRRRTEYIDGASVT